MLRPTNPVLQTKGTWLFVTDPSKCHIIMISSGFSVKVKTVKQKWSFPLIANPFAIVISDFSLGTENKTQVFSVLGSLILLERLGSWMDAMHATWLQLRALVACHKPPLSPRFLPLIHRDSINTWKGFETKETCLFFIGANPWSFWGPVAQGTQWSASTC